VLPWRPDEFEAAVREHALRLATDATIGRRLARKAAARSADERQRPLETHRIREPAEMSRGIFDDRYGFAVARCAFVTKQPPPAPDTARPGRHAAVAGQ
jgi:putative two-component system protein, hydrogenase maturation factor HypX/HoxX